MNRMIFALICAVPLTIGGSAQAEEAGEYEFIVACSGCHGVSGQGDGPLADLMNIPVPDLTQLSAGAGGQFPFSAVLATIDGRDDVRAHGSVMPVWGERFASSATSRQGESADMVARGRVLSLAVYLESIQQ